MEESEGGEIAMKRMIKMEEKTIEGGRGGEDCVVGVG